MKTQFVQMTTSGVKAYYSAAKAMRKEAAEFYRDNPTVLLSEVSHKFKLSLNSLRKGLAENGIEVERDRRFDRPVKRLLCRDCGERVHHVCREQGKRPESRQYRPEQPRTMLGVNGKPLERTPEYIAYVESVWKPTDTPRLPTGEPDFSDDTPEQRELAELGMYGLFERARKELGIG